MVLCEFWVKLLLFSYIVSINSEYSFCCPFFSASCMSSYVHVIIRNHQPLFLPDCINILVTRNYHHLNNRYRSLYDWCLRESMITLNHEPKVTTGISFLCMHRLPLFKECRFFLIISMHLDYGIVEGFCKVLPLLLTLQICEVIALLVYVFCYILPDELIFTTLFDKFSSIYKMKIYKHFHFCWLKIPRCPSYLLSVLTKFIDVL